MTAAVATAVLRTPHGPALPVADGRWAGPADPLDRRVLARLPAPVLDVGCGPGRHVVALAEAGVPALGIDVTPEAVRTARARGGLALERSVFDRVPGSGRWASALLLDGNVGIGGDPVTLVARVAELLAPGGRLLVETGPPGSGGPVHHVRLELDGRPGPWFRWAEVGADEVDGLAAGAGAAVAERWRLDGRWFGLLERR